jgi:hypothetical protein
MMHPKITDVTPLFFDEMDDDEMIIHLWYRSDELIYTKIKNRKCKKILDTCFDDMGFPEYKPIAYAAYNFLKSNKYDMKDLAICVVVDEKSKFAKKHEDSKGFIELFTLMFDKFKLGSIHLNANLISEKIILLNEEKKLPNFADEELGDEENDIQCVICMSDKGQLVETPCHHKFHLNCIRCTPKLICPFCKTNLIEFLEENGVPEQEIKQRLTEEIKEEKLEHFHEALNTLSEDDIEEMDDMDFMRLCLEMLKLNDGNIIPYNHLILDMNANASHLFAEISSIKCKKEKGLFMYIYPTLIEFIAQMKDPFSKSDVEWMPISKLDETPLKGPIEYQLNTIEDFSQKYMVAVMIENVINVQIMDKDMHEKMIRINYHDILESIMRCTICRCSGDTPSAPNKEHKWAKTVLTNMKRKYSKNVRKFKHKKTKAESLSMDEEKVNE